MCVCVYLCMCVTVCHSTHIFINFVSYSTCTRSLFFALILSYSSFKITNFNFPIQGNRNQQQLIILMYCRTKYYLKEKSS